MSTPKFIKALTDISYELIAQPNKEDYLKEELKKINKFLPASVYIPFVNSKDIILILSESMRNYAILHIVTDEAKVFQTKVYHNKFILLGKSTNIVMSGSL